MPNRVWLAVQTEVTVALPACPDQYDSRRDDCQLTAPGSSQATFLPRYTWTDGSFQFPMTIMNLPKSLWNSLSCHGEMLTFWLCQGQI
jgi:hypothetical protein